jgi:hypothetical protein
MSTAELLEAIRALPPEKQKQVESYVHQLRESDTPLRYADTGQAREVAARIFEENKELFQKLAR